MSNSTYVMVVTSIQLIVAVFDNPSIENCILVAILFLGSIMAYAADSIIKEIRRSKCVK